MKDELDNWLAQQGRITLSDNGFTERVMEHIAPPPSRNIYRIPTLVTAALSVIMLIVIQLSNVNITGWVTDARTSVTERITEIDWTKLNPAQSNDTDRQPEQ